jgi:hypothetical protein
MGEVFFREEDKRSFEHMNKDMREKSVCESSMYRLFPSDEML